MHGQNLTDKQHSTTAHHVLMEKQKIPVSYRNPLRFCKLRVEKYWSSQLKNCQVETKNFFHGRIVKKHEKNLTSDKEKRKHIYIISAFG